MTSRATRLLILGTTGQVGREVMLLLSSLRARLDFVAASRSGPEPGRRFDLASPDTVHRLVAEVRPDHVVLLAAATDVRWCEEHPSESLTINVLGTEAAAQAARRAGATLTFVSTDYVFDGLHGPYGEADETNPLNTYGAHKLAAEAVVMGENPHNLVLRTCQVFGDDPRRKNYVLRVVDSLRRGELVEAAGDLYGTPTYAPDLANALVDLTLSGADGVWHLAGETFLSRYELARRVAFAFECHSGSIVEVDADQMRDPVNRPRRSGLRIDRLAEKGGRWTTPLESALAELVRLDRQP